MKKTANKRKSVAPKKTTFWRRMRMVITAPFAQLNRRIQNLKSRRPHRSFRLTRCRDYKRSLKLPGYWAFTLHVAGELKKRWGLFFSLILLYAFFSVMFGSMTSQDVYREIGELLGQGTPEAFSGSWGKIGQASILAISAFTGGATTPTEVQQLYIGLIAILTWLATVWILREILAGRKPNLRDGLYSSGAPLISTVLVFAILLVQLVPTALLAILYGALVGLGLITEGFSLFLFSLIAVLVISLTLYWIVATLIALVVITLPGMYPLRAVRIAGDLVIGRRLRILLRLLWMFAIAVVAWLVIMVPIVLLDGWVSTSVDWGWVDWLPIVPFIASVLGSATAVWMASYVYLLYRKVVDDDAAPA